MTAFYGGYAGSPVADLCGTSAIVGLHDGLGGTDILLSIEEIIASALDDTVVFREDIALITGILQQIWGGDHGYRGDTLDFNDYGNGIDIQLSLNFATDSVSGAAVIAFVEFENIIGTNNADQITGEGQN